MSRPLQGTAGFQETGEGGKYFALTLEGAQNFANAPQNDNYTVTATLIPKDPDRPEISPKALP